MAAMTCELQFFFFKLSYPVTFSCGNKAAQQIAANPCYYDDRTNHLELDFHFTLDKGILQTAHISSQQQPADLMTKPRAQHTPLSGKLGIAPIPSLGGGGGVEFLLVVIFSLEY